MSDLLRVSGGPTKPEIIAIALSKLKLRSYDRFFDVGCGTGAVSIEASSLVDSLHITAIDARKEAIEVAKKNFEAFNIPNVNLVFGESSDVIAQAEKVDCAFVGGSKNILEVLDALAAKKARRIVVDAVRIETVVKIIHRMQELGIFHEVIHVMVSRGVDLVGETMFKPENPVYIIVGGTDKTN
ncbi:MAG: precorrin-6Y C5,15-methyltransferase (decarboxylating) subunit CbiT [Methanomethylovorans sp.]|jgi:cobalt-precorrin-6B (C15)-methyltransferase|nr:precorrin-6Y C5,15-methyltransferase (decarboxylating) subunit CbiT [Methanomethylovorans sp.]